MTHESHAQPIIIEAYQGYTPSFNVAKLIRKMTREVHPKFLVGLKSVVLTNKTALSRKDRERKLPLRGRRVVQGDTLGYYSQEWKGEPACITLLVDNIEKRCSGGWSRFGFFRISIFSDVFFHELGHHIHRVHRPRYEEREDVANKWSKKLSARFMVSRYWYMLPIAAPIALVAGLRSDITALYRKMRTNRKRKT
jgi:hypothetical protein